MTQTMTAPTTMATRGNCPDCGRRLTDVSGDWVTINLTVHCPRCSKVVTVALIR